MIKLEICSSTATVPRVLESMRGRRRPSSLTSLLGAGVLLAGTIGCGLSTDQSSDDPLETISSNLTASKFKGWVQVPLTGAPAGLFSSGPATAARGTASVDVFARGADTAVWSNFGYTFDNWTTTTWLGWSSLGGALKGKPAASAYGPLGDQLVVAGRGTNNQAYVRVTVPVQGGHPTFTDWSQVSNGNLSNEPAVTYRAPYIYVFGNGTDNKVYWSRNDVSSGFDPNGWQAWTGPIPNGVLSSEPAVASLNGALYVVGRGTDNRCYFTKSTDGGSTWIAWVLVSTNTFSSGPALTVSPNGQLNVFAPLNGNNHMFSFTSNDGGASWGAVVDAGGNLPSSPGASSPASGLIQTFGRGTDNAIYWNRYQE